jgi:hypothetical protein
MAPQGPGGAPPSITNGTGNRPDGPEDAGGPLQPLRDHNLPKALGRALAPSTGGRCRRRAERPERGQLRWCSDGSHGPFLSGPAGARPGRRCRHVLRRRIRRGYSEIGGGGTVVAGGANFPHRAPAAPRPVLHTAPQTTRRCHGRACRECARNAAGPCDPDMGRRTAPARGAKSLRRRCFNLT